MWPSRGPVLTDVVTVNPSHTKTLHPIYSDYTVAVAVVTDVVTVEPSYTKRRELANRWYFVWASITSCQV